MERRNFIKAIGAIGVGTLFAPQHLLPAEVVPTKSNPKRIVKTTLPELPHGNIGIITGIAGSGRSFVLYSKYNANPNAVMFDLERIKQDFNVEMLLDIPKNTTVFIDSFHLVQSTASSISATVPTPSISQHYMIRRMNVICRERNLAIWTTIHSNRNLDNTYSIHPLGIYASMIVVVNNNQGGIYGDDTKNRYKELQSYYFGRPSGTKYYKQR